MIIDRFSTISKTMIIPFCLYSKKFFLIILILLTPIVGFISCGPKVYPSGLEGNLLGYQGNFNRERKKRKREARRNDRKIARVERKEKRPELKKQKEIHRYRKEIIASHIAKQEPHVQKRMKQNLRETEKKYRSQRSVKEKVLFWKKNKCIHGL